MRKKRKRPEIRKLVQGKACTIELGLETRTQCNEMNTSLNYKHWLERCEEWCKNWLTMQSRKTEQAVSETDKLLCKCRVRKQMQGQAMDCSSALRPREGGTTMQGNWDSKPSCLSTASAKHWYHGKMAFELRDSAQRALERTMVQLRGWR